MYSVLRHDTRDLDLESKTWTWTWLQVWLQVQLIHKLKYDVYWIVDETSLYEVHHVALGAYRTKNSVIIIFNLNLLNDKSLMASDLYLTDVGS